MVPRPTTAFGVVPPNIHAARIAQYRSGAQVFVADDGSEADTMAHGSLHGNVLHVFLPWGLVPPRLE